MLPHIPLSPAPPLPLAKLLQEVLAQLQVRPVHLRVQTPPLDDAFRVVSYIKFSFVNLSTKDSTKLTLGSAKVCVERPVVLSDELAERRRGFANLNRVI